MIADGQCVIGIRQVDDVVFNEGLIPGAGLEIARCGAHVKVASPEGTQVHIDSSLDINEQGTLTLFL